MFQHFDFFFFISRTGSESLLICLMSTQVNLQLLHTINVLNKSKLNMKNKSIQPKLRGGIFFQSGYNGHTAMTRSQQSHPQ